MGSKKREASLLAAALEGVPGEVRGRLEQISELSEDEAALLRTAVEPGSLVQELAGRLLDEWGRLTIPERVGSLLVIAEELRRNR